MKASEEAARAAPTADWRRFLTPRVAALVEAGAQVGDKVERPVAVLFVDLVGCAHLCEELAPTEMNEVIESYFSRFFDLVQEVGGSVNEIMGDGFMAIFEDESPEANTSHAVSAALKVLAVMDQTSPTEGDLNTQVHIGLHAGTALVGFTRFRAKRWERWTYTASGPVTNIAARLCQHARPGEIVVSEDVIRLVGDRFRSTALGKVSLKNVRRPVQIFRIVSEKGTKRPPDTPGRV